MKKFLPGFLCCLFVFGASGAWAQVPAVLGVWDLNLKASTLPAQCTSGACSEVRNYYMRDDGYVVAVVLRANPPNGLPDFIQVAAKSDGQDYPQYNSGTLADLTTNGTPTPDTYSETITDERTADIIARRNGVVNNRGTRTISEDGKRMTLDVTPILPDGTELARLQLVFDKRE
jgi:hypothetical protein